MYKQRVPKVLIVQGSGQYAKMFLNNGFEITSSFEDCDIVCFTGGEDVSPSLYGENTHHTTYSNIKRDEFEKSIFLKAVEDGKFCVGICRGGQFLNVMNGGKMYQDVENHCGIHPLTDLLTGEEIMVSSTHHQMMRPEKHGALVVATAQRGGGKEWMEGDVIHKTFEGDDTEVVWYANTLSLCFQPHPEFSVMSDAYSQCAEYFFKLISRFFKE